MKSIRTKMITLVLCCIIITCAAIGSASIINSKRVVSSDSSRIMNLLCENRADQMNALFSRIEQSVETLKLYAVHQLDDVERFRKEDSYIEDYTGRLREAAVNAAMNTEGARTVYIRYNPEFTSPTSGIFYSEDVRRSQYSEVPPTDLSKYDSSDREHVGWFYEPAEKGKGTWMSPYNNENIGLKIISYVVPYYVGDMFIGVVGMDIEFSMLENIVSDTGVYRSGYTFLTDQNAKIVYHKDLKPDTDLTNFNHSEFGQMADTIKKGVTSGNQLIDYSYQGVKKRAAFRSLKNNMRLVLTAPEREIDEQGNLLIMQIAVATLSIASVAIVLTVMFTRHMVKPLLELTAAARKIEQGDLSVIISHHSKDEVGELSEVFRQTVVHLKQHINYINQLAYRDSLTGVKNKRSYLETLYKMNEMLQEMKEPKPKFATVVLDINGLKAINDTHGHDHGDKLICNSCRIICNVFKKSPVYRIGGDEFVVILEGDDYENYPQLLGQFRMEIQKYNSKPENILEISIACGLAVYAEETDQTYNDVFNRADIAMYRNKVKMKEKSQK